MRDDREQRAPAGRRGEDALQGEKPALRHREGRGRHHLRHSQRRDLRRGGGVRLRQVHPGAAAHPAAGPHRGDHHPGGGGRLPAEGAGPEGDAEKGPDHLPGPLRLPQPPADRPPDPPGALRDPRHDPKCGRPHPRAPHPGGAGRLPPQPVPPRALRRPEAAHRHRPGPGPGAQAHHLRRGGVRPGRVRPGPGPQPPPGAEGKAGADLLLHLPQPQRGLPGQRPGGGHVPREDGGDRRL